MQIRFIASQLSLVSHSFIISPRKMYLRFSVSQLSLVSHSSIWAQSRCAQLLLHASSATIPLPMIPPSGFLVIDCSSLLPQVGLQTKA
jgi:hypothetical protein